MGDDTATDGARPGRLSRKRFDEELLKLQRELVIMQEYVKAKGLKVVVIFEGRDAAGKGGVIKRIAERTNPRVCRVVALPAPTEREKTQWYFQRYVAHLPAAGEIVLFDRSWYNRAGVERVMGFCTEAEYEEFMRSCPEFERMLVRSGIQVIKYWFSVSDEEQERRFQARVRDPMRRWKLSPMDLESRARWVQYSRAKDEMFRYTDIKHAPWWVVAMTVAGGAAPAASARAVAYWIAAVPVTWNVVPNGHDAIMGTTFSSADTVFPAVVYRKYTRNWHRVVPNVPGDSSNQNLIL